MITKEFTSQMAVISAAASGANEIVGAVAGKRIVVLSYTLIPAGDVTATWKSDSTAISGAMSRTTASVLTASHSAGVLQTAVGEALVLTLGGAVQTSGHVTYILQE